MTRSLGQRQSEKNTQPEVLRWRDAGQSHVTCTFVGGTRFCGQSQQALPPAP
jgi:hypothetical protein